MPIPGELPQDCSFILQLTLVFCRGEGFRALGDKIEGGHRGATRPRCDGDRAHITKLAIPHRGADFNGVWRYVQRPALCGMWGKIPHQVWGMTEQRARQQLPSLCSDGISRSVQHRSPRFCGYRLLHLQPPRIRYRQAGWPSLSHRSGTLCAV